MKRTSVALTMFFVLSGRAEATALAGVPPVVVLAGFTTGTAHTTIADVTQDMASRYFPTLWTDSSYGAFRPTISNVYDWLEVPTGTWCGLSEIDDSTFGQAVERAALTAGIAFPNGVIPVVIAPECGHVENRYVSSLPNTYNGLGIFSDGKLLNETLGEILGLPIARAFNTPLNPVNNFDPFTPMGFTDFPHRISGIETLQLGWITSAQVFTGSGTHVVEAMEVLPTTNTKLWFVQGTGVNIDARMADTTVVPFIHAGHDILDLETTTGNQYALPPGQIFAINGVGIRNDGASATGVTVSTFPYTGPSTVTCVGGVGSFCGKSDGGSPPPPPPQTCVKNCTPPPPQDCTKNCTPPPPPPPSTDKPKMVGMLDISCGDLYAGVRGNSDQLSGLGWLSYTGNSNQNAFTYGGVNFEHIDDLKDEGPLDTATHTMLFTPRYGPLTATQVDATTVKLTRLASDEPWNLDAVQFYHCAAPHAIDYQGNFTPRDATKFAPDPSTGLRPGFVFIASYMAQMGDLDHWIKTATGWLKASYPPSPYFDKGGVYRSAGASQLYIDPAKEDQLDIYSYNSPLFTTPLMVHRGTNGMVFITMWDRGYTAADELRMVQMRWNVKDPTDPSQWTPADDWEFWWHNTVADETHTIRARYVWLYLPNATDDQMLAAADAEYAGWTPWIAQ